MPARLRKWLRRFREEDAAELEDRSSQPQRTPHATPATRVTFIRQFREQHGRPGWAIARALRMPRSPVGAWRRRLGLNRLPAPSPVPIQCYEGRHPGDPLPVDINPLGRFRRVGHRIHGNPRQASPGAGRDYVQVAVDDHTRLAYVEVLGDQTGTTCAAFLDRAVAWRAARQINIRRVMSDNGSGYASPRARTACRAHALRHLRTRPFQVGRNDRGADLTGRKRAALNKLTMPPPTSLDIGFSLDPCPGK